jgi:hypothetical protein
MDLSEDEIRRFAEACNDPSHPAAREVMLAAGANSASGVLARILLTSGPERQRLIDLIRSILK